MWNNDFKDVCAKRIVSVLCLLANLSPEEKVHEARNKIVFKTRVKYIERNLLHIRFPWIDIHREGILVRVSIYWKIFLKIIFTSVLQRKKVYEVRTVIVFKTEVKYIERHLLNGSAEKGNWWESATASEISLQHLYI